MSASNLLTMTDIGEQMEEHGGPAADGISTTGSTQETILQPPKLWSCQPTIQIEAYHPADLYTEMKDCSETYHIHRDFFHYYSDLFRMKYKTALTETKDLKLRILFPDTTSVGNFIEWCYTQKMDTEDCTQCDYLWLWLFAEKIGAPKLQNYILSHLEDMRKQRCIVLIDTIVFRYLYEQTTVGGPLKRYLVDTWNDVIQLHEASLYPPALLVDLFNARKGKYYRHNANTKLDIKEYFVDEEKVAERFLKPQEIKSTVAGGETEKVVEQQATEGGGNVLLEASKNIKREGSDTVNVGKPAAKKRKGGRA